MRGLPAFITGRAHRGRDRSGGSRRRGALFAALLVIAALIPAGRPPAMAQDVAGITVQASPVVFSWVSVPNQTETFMNSNPTFTYTYKCYSPAGTAFAEGTVTLKGREETRLEFPTGDAGTDYCMFWVEKDEDAHVPGFTFQSSTPYKGVLTTDPTRKVYLSTYYNVIPGDFTVSKVVTGEPPSEWLKTYKQYRFTYTCTTDAGAVQKGLVWVQNGKSVKTSVVASDCVIKEADVDSDFLNADVTTTYSVNGGASTSEPPTVRATRGDGGNPTVTVNNHYAELRGD
ncbi:DUF5979 domain-containing protein, partial [Actinomyces slackii]